jgi:penicillin-binding protein 1C
VQDAAALVVDNRSGEVLAYASQSGADSVSPHSDGVRAPRQAGSTLKPILYGQALEQRLLTAASPLDDSPMAIADAGGVYAPRNYDLGHRGLVSVRPALAASLNIPAVRVLQLVGLEPFAAALNRFGFAGLTEAADFYGYALALGGLDVRLEELVNAYRALANGGLLSPLRFTPEDPAVSPRRVLGRESAFLSPTSSPTGRPARSPSAWRTPSPPASGARSRLAPARTCATTGASASPPDTRWGSG